MDLRPRAQSDSFGVFLGTGLWSMHSICIYLERVSKVICRFGEGEWVMSAWLELLSVGRIVVLRVLVVIGMADR